MVDEQNRDAIEQPIPEQGTEQTPPEAQPAEGEQSAPDQASSADVQAAPEPGQWATPENVTREQLDALRAEFQGAVEQVKRDSQSMTDKAAARLQRQQEQTNERIQLVDELLSNPRLAPYLGDDLETVRRELAAEQVVNSYRNAQSKQEDTQPQPQQQQSQQDMMQTPLVQNLLREYGVSAQDPEFVHPSAVTNEEAYRRVLEMARAQKRQRLASQQQPKPTTQPQQQPTQQPTSPPAQAPAQPRQAAQVSMGTGGAPRPKTVSEIQAELTRLRKEGDPASLAQIPELRKRLFELGRSSG